MDELRSVLLVQALARIWSRIREIHPEVPGAVILAAPSTHRHLNVLGHFAALRWRGHEERGRQLHEVVVVAEHLDRTAEDVAETLLHEAAHAMNFARGVHDCSTSQYHNRKFEETATGLGLDVSQVPHYGFALTKMAQPTALRYELEIAHLKSVLIHRRRHAEPASGPGPTPTNGGSPPDDGEATRTRSRKATCACPFIIRASRKTLSETTIRCESCGEPFTMA